MAINDVKTTMVSESNDVIDHTPSGAVAAGDIVIQDKLVGIAKSPIAAGKMGSLCIRGIFLFPCGSEDLATVGTPAYLVVATGIVTATSGGANANIFLGKTVEASSGTNPLKTVKVLLEPSYTLMA
jgi:predicted RecA/RadA family phage recombinase